MVINTALVIAIIIKLSCSPKEKRAFTSIHQREIAEMCRLPGDSCAASSDTDYEMLSSFTTPREALGRLYLIRFHDITITANCKTSTAL